MQKTRFFAIFDLYDNNKKKLQTENGNSALAHFSVKLVRRIWDHSLDRMIYGYEVIERYVQKSMLKIAK